MSRLARPQRVALQLIATMGDVSVDRQRRRGLRIPDRTLAALEKRGLVTASEVAMAANADGTSASRHAWVLTDAGRAALETSP